MRTTEAILLPQSQPQAAEPPPAYNQITHSFTNSYTPKSSSAISVLLNYRRVSAVGQSSRFAHEAQKSRCVRLLNGTARRELTSEVAREWLPPLAAKKLAWSAEASKKLAARMFLFAGNCGEAPKHRLDR